MGDAKATVGAQMVTEAIIVWGCGRWACPFIHKAVEAELQELCREGTGVEGA